MSNKPDGKVTDETLTDMKIRQLHNCYRDGTGNDAIGRYLCRVALGELCIGDDMPGGLRYPTEDEIRDARRRLVDSWNARFGAIR